MITSALVAAITSGGNIKTDDVGPNVGEVDGRLLGLLFGDGSLGDVVGWIEGSLFVVGVTVGEKDGIVVGSYVT